MTRIMVGEMVLVQATTTDDLATGAGEWSIAGSPTGLTKGTPAIYNTGGKSGSQCLFTAVEVGSYTIRCLVPLQSGQKRGREFEIQVF